MQQHVPRIIGYYQTFDANLNFVKLAAAGLTHVHLSSVHFGVEDDGQPYIHLNNLAPEHPNFDLVWAQMSDFKRCGGIVMIMIGGAGGGYSTLLDPKYRDVCFALLVEFLSSKKELIDGVDYDVEETVDLDVLVDFHKALRAKIPALRLSFAPLAGSLQSDDPGMGGFSYKSLLPRLSITYFNGQFYADYGPEAFSRAVKNGYGPNKIVMGCLAGQENATKATVAKTARQFPNIGGVFVWEIGQATPSPLEWVAQMRTALQEAVEAFHEGGAPSLVAFLPSCAFV